MLACRGVFAMLSILRRCASHVVPVSYTHLDVYKRQGMSSQKKTSRLEGKDLITIGIYTVIYVVIVMLVAMLDFIPIFIPLMAVLCPLIGGIPYMLYVTKDVYKRQDVSNYVKPGTELDNEAFSRATSVYYADQVVPL